MTYAHQGIELRPLPGLLPPQHIPTLADASFKGSEQPHPVLLTRKGTHGLVHAEHPFDDASHALTVQDRPPGSLRAAFDGNKDGASPLTAARDTQSPTVSRGD